MLFIPKDICNIYVQCKVSICKPPPITRLRKGTLLTSLDRPCTADQSGPIQGLGRSEKTDFYCSLHRAGCSRDSERSRLRNFFVKCILNWNDESERIMLDELINWKVKLCTYVYIGIDRYIYLPWCFFSSSYRSIRKMDIFLLKL